MPSVNSELVSWNDSTTEDVTHLFENTSSGVISFLWIKENGEEVKYNELEPGHSSPQQSYSTHAWRFRSQEDGRVIGEYVGHSKRLVIHDSCIELLPLEDITYEPKPEWGAYRVRATSSSGLEIWSFDCVDKQAIKEAQSIIDHMLNEAKSDVIKNLLKCKCKVSIIGRDQYTTDIPEHSYLKLQRGGRDMDSTTRGLGGSLELPVTSCGEENLTMVDDKSYSMENILIHEFGHSIMNIGMSPEDRKRVCECYEKARSKEMYSRDIYMISNEDEYWAEGCQSWFDASIRSDVNDGHNTREKLKQHDPDLCSILAETLGDGSWRYPHTAPSLFGQRKRQRAESNPISSPVMEEIEMDRSPNPSPRWEEQIRSNCGSLCPGLPSLSGRFFRSCFGPLFASAMSIKRM